MTDRRQHAAHLSVLTLMDGQFHLGAAHAPRPFREPLAHAYVFGGLGDAVFQANAERELLQRFRAGNAAHGGPVGLRHVVLGMGQSVEKIAVVGQEDQTLAVRIQPADRTQHRLALQIHQVRDKASRVRIVQRADDILGFIEYDIVALGRLLHQLGVK